jgi:hypothetical protein
LLRGHYPVTGLNATILYLAIMNNIKSTIIYIISLNINHVINIRKEHQVITAVHSDHVLTYEEYMPIFYGLFNSIASISDYITSNGRMISELKRMWKEAIMA